MYHTRFREFSILYSLISILLLLALAGCAPPNMSWQAMGDQPRYDTLQESTFFPNNMSARPLPPNVVPRGSLQEDTEFYTGKVAGSNPARNVETFPFVVSAEDMVRGQERYNIYCTPCHDPVGTGNGVVVLRGFTPPPSLHIDRLRQSPVGHYFDVITNGWGAMPSYANQISPRDRWLITAYIRALQLSQNARLEDVPAADRAKLDAGGSR
jgi:mono/diheme cytochrome c family protein